MYTIGKVGKSPRFELSTFSIKGTKKPQFYKCRSFVEHSIFSVDVSFQAGHSLEDSMP